MLRFVSTTAALVFSFAGLTGAQPRAACNAVSFSELDHQIERIKDLPDHSKAEAVHEIAIRIRQQPLRCELPLAFNLAIDGEEAANQTTVQEIADVLSDALAKLGASTEDRGCYRQLAELVHSAHVRTICHDPRLIAALKQLAQEDRQLNGRDFALSDLNGRTWTLRQLHGRVVLVNFWETWCPPCRREMPELERVYERFRSQGLVVLSITYEEAQVVRRFADQNQISFPILLDPRRITEKLFTVSGFPKNVVFDRGGHMVASWNDRPSHEALIKMIRAGGLQK